MQTMANAAAGAGQAITVRLNVHERCEALFASGPQPPAADSMTESISRHCASRVRAALGARGWTIWPVVRARRALQGRHGLPLRCPANCPEDNPLTDEGT